jgi:hypothetical protein
MNRAELKFGPVLLLLEMQSRHAMRDWVAA